MIITAQHLYLWQPRRTQGTYFCDNQRLIVMKLLNMFVDWPLHINITPWPMCVLRSPHSPEVPWWPVWCSSGPWGACIWFFNHWLWARKVGISIRLCIHKLMRTNLIGCFSATTTERTLSVPVALSICTGLCFLHGTCLTPFLRISLIVIWLFCVIWKGWDPFDCDL